MPPKRKRKSILSRPAKKRAPARLSKKWWNLKTILEETETKYLIDWEGEDDEGVPYEPTWEPKSFANELAIADWEDQKRLKTEATAAKASKNAVPAQPLKQRSARRRRQAAQESLEDESPPRKRTRYSARVIESSPPGPSSTLKSCEGPNHGQDPEAATQELVIGESEPEDESDFPSTAAQRIAARVQEGEPEDESEFPTTAGQRVAARVQLSDPPSSYQAGAYKKITLADSSRLSPRGESSGNSSEVAINSVKLTQSTADGGSPAQAVPTSSQDTVDKDTSLCVPESQHRQQSESPSFRGPSLSAQSQPETNEQEDATEAAEDELSLTPPVVPSIQGTDEKSTHPCSAESQNRQQSNSSSFREPSLDAQSKPGTNERADATEAVEDEPTGELHEALVLQTSQHFSVASARPGEACARSSEGVEDTVPEHQIEPSQIAVSTGDQQLASAGSRPHYGFGAQAEHDQVPKGAQSEVRSAIGSVQQSTYQTADLDAEKSSDSTAEHLPLKRTIVGEQQGTPADSIPEPSSITDNQSSCKEPEATQAPPNVLDQSQDTEDVRPAHEGHYIVISSEDDHIRISTHETPNQSHDFLSQAKYEPPPGAQRPLPSSVLNGQDSGKASQLEHLPINSPHTDNVESLSQTEGPSLSSFPFQTQLVAAAETTPRKGESRMPTTPFSRTAEYAASVRASSRPPSARSNGSTPFPSIPNYTIGTVGESAPPRIHTPSPMESMSARLNQHRERDPPSTRQTPIPGQPVSSLPPIINAEVQAAHAARLASPGLFLADSRRSPSAVPALEPVPHITREEQNTSERYETLLPEAQGISSDSEGDAHDGVLPNTEAHLADIATTTAVHEPIEDAEITNMHVVPIPLSAHQRDQYGMNIRWHEQLLEQFLANRQPPPELVAEVERYLERLRNIATHPDLVNIELLTQASEPSRQAQWDIDSSAKFHFLKALFDGLQSTAPSMHVAVAASGSRLPDMLETFCKGWQISYRRGSSGSASLSDKEGLKVTILDLDRESEPPPSADIVIALDGATDYRHRLIRAARRHTQTAGMTGTNSWAMLLTLVVPRTVEHIERCLNADLPRLVQLRVLVRQAQKLRLEAGKRERALRQIDPKEAAVQVTDFLDNPEVLKWPLGSISQMQDLDSQTQTELSELEASRVESSAAAKDSNGDKRDLETSDRHMSSSHSTKRPRTSPGPPATMNPQDMDITHVSDSVGRTTQPSLNEIFAPPPSIREEQLREELTRVQGQLEEHVRDVEALQYRNEEQRTELVQLRREKDDALSRVQTAIERMSMAENNNSSLKKEGTALKKELEEVRRKLLDHSVPGRAEIEQLRRKADQAEQEREKADDGLKRVEANLEWIKAQYNDARDRCRESDTKNQDLEARLSFAEQQAAGEAARARQISQQTHYKTLERENKKLKAIVRDRDAGLKFRDEEITRLKESTRGRVGTRQTSVPRSPRLGSPMKGGRGSRQASPAAGEPRSRTSNLHVVRNSG